MISFDDTSVKNMNVALPSAPNGATVERGDRVVFRALTRCNSRTNTRIVNGFRDGYILVRFEGCGHFMLRPHEILSVEKAVPYDA